MHTYPLNYGIFLLVLLIPASLTLPGCSPNALDDLGGIGTDGVIAENGLRVDMGDGSSNTVGAIQNPDGGLSLTLFGDHSEDGELLKLTSLSGESEEGFRFSAIISNDIPSLINMAFGQFLLQESTGDALVYAFANLGASSQFVPGMEFNILDFAVNDSTVGMIRDRKEDCEGSNLRCPRQVKRDLSVILTLAKFHRVLDAAFDYRCIETDILQGADCFELLAITDTIGQAIDGIISANPDLPASIRALCFNLSGECDPNNQERPTSLQISGATEICVGEAADYTILAAPDAGPEPLYFWTVDEGQAQLNGDSGYSSRTVTATAAGQITLFVEARDRITAKEIGSGALTIRVRDCNNDSTTDSTGDLSDLNGCWNVTQVDDASGTSFEQIWQIENQQLAKLWGENNSGLIIEAVRFTSPNVDFYQLDRLSQAITPGADPGAFAVAFEHSTRGTLNGQSFDLTVRTVEITGGALGDGQTFTALFHETDRAAILSEDGIEGFDEADIRGSVLGVAIPCPDASQESVLSQEEYAEELSALTSGLAPR